MDRRALITHGAGALAAVALPAWAQPAGKVYRIAVFDYAYVSPDHPNALAFFDELKRRGYVVGRNLVVQRRDAAGSADRVAQVAREVVDWKPDLITASTAAPNLALQQITKTIPILMTAVADPIGVGLVASLARPGGNITGVGSLVPEKFSSKQLQLLRDGVPRAKRVAVFINPDNPMTQSALAPLAPAAERLGLELRVVEVRAAHEVPAAIEAARRDDCHAVHSPGDQILTSPAVRLGQRTRDAGLPLMSISRRQCEDGGFMSYGPDFLDMYRRAAMMADRLLKGARPADLPVELPTKYEFVVNLKTARALDLTVSKNVLFQADVIIE